MKIACRYRFTLAEAVLMGLLLSILAIPAAFAGVDDNGAFELDGNATDAGGTPGDDWNTPPKPGGSATAFTGIVSDKNGTDNIFTGGGSKTPNMIGEWKWKSSPPPPDKDNITHAYAANYIVGGEQIIYFGADLFDTNGDAELAFWVFQNEVATQPDGATSGDFAGSHIDEDPYIAVKFSQGGTVANIAVYEWWSACNKNDRTPSVPFSCAADNIRIVIPLGPATCGTGGDKDACAITNLAYTPAPWSYTSKDGDTDFPPTAFFEGGINIKKVLGENKCFSAFAVTTGASTSFTSTAKDFALDDFNVCSADVTKTCTNDSESDDSPTSIIYNVRGCGINDGGGAINITGLLNSIAGGANAVPSDLAWYVPAQVDDGSGGLRDFNPATDCSDAAKLKEAGDDNGTLVTDLSSEDLGSGEALIYVFSETTSMNAVSDTVTLSADGVDGTDIANDTASATCPPVSFDAGLSVTKKCSADLEDVGSALQVKINVQGMVCNEGEVTLTNLQLTDSSTTPALGTVTLTPSSTTLAPKGDSGGADCTSYTGSYTPASIPTGDICPFADVVDASATAPINSAGTGCSLNSDGTSTCVASSNSATCNLRAVNTDGDCSTGPLSTLPD